MQSQAAAFHYNRLYEIKESYLDKNKFENVVCNLANVLSLYLALPCLADCGVSFRRRDPMTAETNRNEVCIQTTPLHSTPLRNQQQQRKKARH